ncbi:MAG: hypothetical protein HeimC2_40150 [Candidatus Heimdallarchaeota archaeon LC_2]|nr:MAG: hypothetical protein HeimC2_40150 [Candidatus Heimdallarchaeota archaeon LC_2]
MSANFDHIFDLKETSFWSAKSPKTHAWINRGHYVIQAKSVFFSKLNIPKQILAQFDITFYHQVSNLSFSNLQTSPHYFSKDNRLLLARIIRDINLKLSSTRSEPYNEKNVNKIYLNHIPSKKAIEILFLPYDSINQHISPSTTSTKKQVTLTRINRDTKLIRKLKKSYDDYCQVCNNRLEADLVIYSEGAHIKPLGTPHNGSDLESNILILCPNHHKELDIGALTIDPYDGITVLHYDLNNTYHKSKINNNHQIDELNLIYHKKNIFVG